MGKCITDLLEPGMTLASDLVTPDGRIMLASGSPLTEAVIRACKMWGVSEADIIGGEPESGQGEEQKQGQIHEAYKRLAAKRFSLTNTRHPAVRTLALLFAENAQIRLSPEEAETWLQGLNRPKKPAHSGSKPCPLTEVLDSEIKLASLPGVFNEISEALRNPRSSASYVADIISKDVSLAARLLRMVNTPFYGFPGAIDTLSRAVTIVGTKQLTSLALGISVISAFNNIPEEHLSLEGFWRHSITCGTTARLLATHLRLGNDERFFVAGLMHDIGRLMLLRNRTDMALAALERTCAGRKPLHELEQELWGWDHAELGAELLKAWRLPGFLERLVRYHHAPARAPQALEAGVIHVAEITAHAVGSGASGSPFVPPLDEGSWDMLGISTNDLREIAAQATRQADEVMAAFFHES